VLANEGRADGPPLATTFSDVHKRRVDVGRRVGFRGVFHPWNIIEIRISGEEPRYYGLLISRESEYFSRLSKAAAAVETWQSQEIPIFEEAFRNGFGYGRATREFDELEELVRNAGELRKSDRILGVRLKGFRAVAEQMEWEAIGSFTTNWTPGATDFEALLASMKDREPFSFDEVDAPWTLVDLRIRIEKLAAERPPDLGKELPDLGRGYSGPEDEKLAAEVVDLYDAEVRRRQDYVLQTMKERLLELRIGLRQLLDLKDRQLSMQVEEFDYDVARMFSSGGMPDPDIILVEEGPPEETFAVRQFGATDVLVISYPPDAEVERDGRVVGRTPFVLSRVPVGQTVRLDFRLEGHVGTSAHAKAEITTEGFVRVQAVLRPE